jgi:hypothetical protein
LHGGNAVWKDVAQRLLDNTCQQRTGRHEEGRVLAGVRDAVAPSGSPIRSLYAWMSGWPRSITLRPCRTATARLWRKSSASHARWPTSWPPSRRRYGPSWPNAAAPTPAVKAAAAASPR